MFLLGKWKTYNVIIEWFFFKFTMRFTTCLVIIWNASLTGNSGFRYCQRRQIYMYIKVSSVPKPANWTAAKLMTAVYLPSALYTSSKTSNPQFLKPWKIGLGMEPTLWRHIWTIPLLLVQPIFTTFSMRTPLLYTIYGSLRRLGIHRMTQALYRGYVKK